MDDSLVLQIQQAHVSFNGLDWARENDVEAEGHKDFFLNVELDSKYAYLDVRDAGQRNAFALFLRQTIEEAPNVWLSVLFELCAYKQRSDCEHAHAVPHDVPVADTIDESVENIYRGKVSLHFIFLGSM